MQWCSCAVAVESKVESMQDKNGTEWKPSVWSTSEGLEIEQERKEAETVFYLREWGIGDECGKVMKLVQWCEEFCDGDVWRSIRGEENVGDIMKADEFCNSW